MKQRLIQIITSNSNFDQKTFNSPEIKLNPIHSPEALDTYSINLIDLRSSIIWESTDTNTNDSNISKDLVHIRKMIENSKTTTIVYLYPQNSYFRYHYTRSSNSYHSSIELKYIINNIELILYRTLKLPLNFIQFERNKTELGEIHLNSDFYFNTSEDIITESSLSQKGTTIKNNGSILTTLEIKTSTELIRFLEIVGLINDTETSPEWMMDIEFFNDLTLKNEIKHLDTQIQKFESLKREKDLEIKKNEKFKSIIYSSGNQLVTTIFEILEKMLNYDLSNFIDKKEEDFIIKTSNVIFIGEIKGISTNIKSLHISQLDVHYHNYLESQSEELKIQVKPLLIICHQRNKIMSDREPIHENQIKLAIRNECLVIETPVLLKVFEFYLEKKISTAQIIEKFKNKTGILAIENFLE